MEQELCQLKIKNQQLAIEREKFEEQKRLFDLDKNRFEKEKQEIIEQFRREQEAEQERF